MSGHHSGLCPGCAEEKPLRDDVNVCEECLEKHGEKCRIDYESEGGKLLLHYVREAGKRIMGKQYICIRVSQEEYDLMFEAVPAIRKFGIRQMMEAGFQSLNIRSDATITVAPRKGIDPPEYFKSVGAFVAAIESDKTVDAMEDT